MLNMVVLAPARTPLRALCALYLCACRVTPLCESTAIFCNLQNNSIIRIKSFSRARKILAVLHSIPIEIPTRR